MADTITGSLKEGWKAVKRGLSPAPPNDAYLQWNAKGVGELQLGEQLSTLQQS